MKLRSKISWVLLTILVVAWLLFQFVLRNSVVVGHSMQPTLQPWDYCLSLRIRDYQPKRGDIVTFRTAGDPPLYVIKRVVGLPGETISMLQGVVQLDGQPLAEPYTMTNRTWNIPPTQVPQDKVFVLSDNRHEPMEFYEGQGLVARRLVIARLLWNWRWRKGNAA